MSVMGMLSAESLAAIKLIAPRLMRAIVLIVFVGRSVFVAAVNTKAISTNAWSLNRKTIRHERLVLFLVWSISIWAGSSGALSLDFE